MTAKERSREIVEMLSYIDDKDERLQFVIDKGKNVPELEDQFKTEEFRIEGCQSNLWLVPEFKGELILFRIDADAVITKGIAALLVEVYSDSTADEIMELDADFLSEAGITQHLTPNRRNGLANISQKIQDYASAHKTGNSA